MENIERTARLKESLRNFEVMTYPTSMKILKEQIFNKNKDGVIYVFAGPGGSGKTTIIANLYKRGFFTNERYISDQMLKELRKNAKKSPDDLNNYMIYSSSNIIKEMKNDGISVVFECQPNEKSIEKLQYAKEIGYRIVTFYVDTALVHTNYEHIDELKKYSVKTSSHEEILEQFQKSSENRAVLENLSDEFYDIENTTRPKLVEKAYVIQ